MMNRSLLVASGVVLACCVVSASALDWWPRLLFSLACFLTVVVGAILAVWVHIKLGHAQKVTVKRPVPVDHVKNALKVRKRVFYFEFMHTIL